MTEATRSSPSGYRATSEASASRALLVRARDVRLGGWLFVLPALAAYGLFVLWPIVQTFKYSLYRWDGVARPSGSDSTTSSPSSPITTWSARSNTLSS